jgi:hypothetical protein
LEEQLVVGEVPPGRLHLKDAVQPRDEAALQRSSLFIRGQVVF